MLPDKKYFRDYAREKNIPWNERNILAEFLQTQVLKALSLGRFSNSLSFLGGTALRFLYNTNRFSEDLGFDLVKKRDFNVSILDKELSEKLGLLGLDFETRVKQAKSIYIIFIKFKSVLQEFRLPAFGDEKLLVKLEIDFSPFKNVKYEAKFIDSFNERFPVLANTLDTIFAQKVVAFLFRPYHKGRDIYDLSWFLAQKDLEPNYRILREKKLEIKNRGDLIKTLKEEIKKVDLKKSVRDVERFLFYPKQVQWVLNFEKFLDKF